MTAESLWDLFIRTGLPEAYSLYHQTASATPEPLHEKSVQAGHGEMHGVKNNIPGT